MCVENVKAVLGVLTLGLEGWLSTPAAYPSMAHPQERMHLCLPGKGRGRPTEMESAQWLPTWPRPPNHLCLWTRKPCGIAEQGDPIILGVSPRSQKTGQSVPALGLPSGLGPSLPSLGQGRLPPWTSVCPSVSQSPSRASSEMG